MAEVKFEKGSIEWQMFQDYYKICQKRWLPEKTETYWNELRDDVCRFSTSYGQVELAKHLMVALFDAMEEKLKK